MTLDPLTHKDKFFKAFILSAALFVTEQYHKTILDILTYWL